MGQDHCCNPSPFPGDSRCVCGTAGSDWRSDCQSRPPVPPPAPAPPAPAPPAPTPSECTSQGKCKCPGRDQCCNPSGFSGDDRCVCGPAASDWLHSCGFAFSDGRAPVALLTTAIQTRVLISSSSA